MFRTDEKLVRGFLGMNGNLDMEDPSYLGFALNFWTHPLFYSSGYLRAPDNLVINSLMLDPKDSTDSSIDYLIGIKENLRATYLRKFIDITTKLQDEKPWYFQGVQGLGELMKPLQDGVTSRKDAMLTIDCLESVDNIMHYWADLYRFTTYDKLWGRNMLPMNKKRFGMDIIVGEFRNLKTIEDAFSDFENLEVSPVDNSSYAQSNTQRQKDLQFSEDNASNSFTDSAKLGWKKGVDSIWNDSGTGSVNRMVDKQKGVAREFGLFGGPKNIKSIEEQNLAKVKLKSILSNMSYHVFRLYDCEFVFDDFQSFDNIRNDVAGDPIKFQFKIKVGYVEEHKEYGMMYNIFDDDVDRLNTTSVGDYSSYQSNRRTYEEYIHPKDDKKAKDNNTQSNGWQDVMKRAANKMASDALTSGIDTVTRKATEKSDAFVSNYTSKIDQIRKKASDGDWKGAGNSALGLFNQVTGKGNSGIQSAKQQKIDTRNTALKTEQDVSYTKLKNTNNFRNNA